MRKPKVFWIYLFGIFWDIFTKFCMETTWSFLLVFTLIYSLLHSVTKYFSYSLEISFFFLIAIWETSVAEHLNSTSIFVTLNVFKIFPKWASKILLLRKFFKVYKKYKIFWFQDILSYSTENSTLTVPA